MNPIEVQSTRTTITLRALCADSDYGLWQWFRDDGKKVSPMFETRQCALEYGRRMPFMTNEDWLTRTIPPIDKERMKGEVTKGEIKSIFDTHEGSST